MLSANRNTKHRAMLTAVYASGLWSGVLIALKVTRLYSDCKRVFLQNAKGKRDRLMPFPDSLRTILRDCYKEYRPSLYLFEGR